MQDVVLSAQEEISATLAALWLRGAPRPCRIPSVRCPAVLRALRTRPNRPIEALREAGFWLEATVLESPGLREWAEERVTRGECLTAADDRYPLRWLSALGDRAPVAVWVKGNASLLERAEWVSIVGSRSISPPVRAFARAVGEEAVRLGYGVVSGRAEGCDAAAAMGAFLRGGAVVEVLPCGLALARGRPRGLWLSACAPDEPFDRGTAMERNALIYAFGSASVVCHARYKEGGTWHGAVDALRRHLTQVLIREEDTMACRALVGLGAVPLTDPEALGPHLRNTETQRGLFSFG